MNQKWKSLLREILMEIIGSALVAVGIYNFAVAARFPMTGFSGIAIILNRLLGVPIGAATVVLNIPVAILCYRLLGRRFFFRSVRCMLISSLIMDYAAPLLPIYQGSRLLAAICTGVVAGLGYALIYMQNSSTGGSDFIIMAIKALRPHLSLGKIAFWSDVGIILVGGYLFKDVDGIIYGMIVNYLFALVVDKVMYGVNSGKMALIVTDHGPRIAQVIEDCCSRGSTLLKSTGGYRQQESHVVMCACSDKQMYQLLQAVKEADPAAFTVILESSEVHGEGFRPLVVGTPEK